MDKIQTQRVISMLMNSQNKKIVLKMEMDNIQNSQVKQTILKFKCKPSLDTLILHDFKSSYLNQNCQQLQEFITLIVTQKIESSQQNQKQQFTIHSIECSNQTHTMYLLALIRLVWQNKISSKNQKLNLQDVIEACEMYRSQFQLQIEDLIQVFQVPLTNEYSRL